MGKDYNIDSYVKMFKKLYFDWILICFVCRLVLYIFDCKILKIIYIYS